MRRNPSAEKRHRQSLEQRQRNRGLRSRLRSSIKRLRQAVEAGDAQQARDLLPPTLRQIDATAQRDVIHRNTAARYKSRLTRAVAALGS